MEQQKKLHDSMTKKLHSSWKVDDHSQSNSQDTVVTADAKAPWSQQELLTGRPDEYVGGYDPAFVNNYRRQQERKKKVKIDGYN